MSKNSILKLKLDIILKLSILKTIIFNIYYLGWKYIIKPVIFVSRDVKIVELKGKLLVDNKITGAIRIGFGNVGIVDNMFCRTIWENSGTIVCKGDAYIGIGTKIVCKDKGILVLGENVKINARSEIICYKGIKIGSGSLISWDCIIMDTDLHEIYRKGGDKKRVNDDRNIEIGSNVWIGCRSTLLKGTEIGDGTVVAACSLVTKNLLGESLYVGNSLKYREVEWK